MAGSNRKWPRAIHALDVDCEAGEMTSEREQHLRQKLREQLDFIEASCTAFDQGKRNEALRIAVHLRVLFHQGKGVALVRQLGKEHVKVLSTAPPPPAFPPEFAALMKHAVPLFTSGLVMLEASPSPGLKAPLGNLPPIALRQVPLQAWLDETVFLSGPHRVTRHELFKWAANKDGGAHVDLDDVPAAYKAYKASGAVGTVNIGGRQFPFEQAHLFALRQMGYEVMNSPEIAELAG